MGPRCSTRKGPEEGVGRPAAWVRGVRRAVRKEGALCRRVTDGEGYRRRWEGTPMHTAAPGPHPPRSSTPRAVRQANKQETNSLHRTRKMECFTANRPTAVGNPPTAVGCPTRGAPLYTFRAPPYHCHPPPLSHSQPHPRSPFPRALQGHPKDHVRTPYTKPLMSGRPTACACTADLGGLGVDLGSTPSEWGPAMSITHLGTR